MTEVRNLGRRATTGLNASGASLHDGSFRRSGVPGEEVVHLTQGAAGGQVGEGVMAEFFRHQMHHPYNAV